MRLNPRSVTRLGCAILALVLGALPLKSSAVDPFDIYVFDSLTGPAAFVGADVQKAFGAVEKVINNKGGINGRPVHFVIQDDATNPQVGVQLMSQAIAKKAQVVVAAVFPPACYSAMALVKDEGPVLYCFASGVRGPVGGYVYSTSFDARDQVARSVSFFNKQGFTKIGLISGTDVGGQDADANLALAFARPENKNLTIVAHEHFNPTDISVAAQLSRIQSSGAQAIICWALGTPLVTVLRGMRDAGMTQPVFVSAANLSYKQMEAYQSVMPSALYVTGLPVMFPDLIGDRTVKSAVLQFRDAMKSVGVTKPDVGSAIVWDTAQVIVNAYNKVGLNATAAQLRDAINASNYVGIYGKFDYKASPQRGITPHWMNVVQWDPTANDFRARTRPGEDK